MTTTSDGSIIDDAGKVVFFSIDRFLRDICEGGCCFICGADPTTTTFNDEHILPDWILGKLNLHSQRITLPNGQGFVYGQYTIPCCKQCNTQMGAELETPISQIIHGGHAEVCEHILNHGPQLIFEWLALIFLKTHLKDRFLRYHRDTNAEGFKISELYDWPELHHIHCIARTFYSKASWIGPVMGSLIVLEAQESENLPSFDFDDLYDCRTILLRVGSTCFIAVLNDSMAGLQGYSTQLERIAAALSPIQLREVMSNLAYINTLLIERPRFGSAIGPSGRYEIHAQRPPLFSLGPVVPADFGALFAAGADSILARAMNPEIEQIRTEVREGRRTFLFDESGRFLTNSMEHVTGG